ncbi:MAG: ATP-binding protein [Methyloceanibacter sp.]
MRPRPGEAALAHLGVLFLDELPEFHPQVLDALRQPLETGETVIARANHRISYPSRIQLIAAMNPCRCGRAGEPGYVCRQGRACAERYQARISGPMLDRIDLQIEVPAVSAADLVLPQPPREAPRCAPASRKPAACRSSAMPRSGLPASAPMPSATARCCRSTRPGRPDAAARGGRCAVTQRAGLYRTLRVARTLADLDGEEAVARIHIAEALSYRGETLRRAQVAA